MTKPTKKVVSFAIWVILQAIVLVFGVLGLREVFEGGLPITAIFWCAPIIAVSLRDLLKETAQ